MYIVRGKCCIVYYISIIILLPVAYHLSHSSLSCLSLGLVKELSDNLSLGSES